MKRFLSLLLSVLLCGCTPAERVARSYLRADLLQPVRQQTSFSDMILTYPDPDTVIRALGDALMAADTETDPEGIIRT